MTDEKNKPAKTLGPVWTGSGYVQVAIWANAGENRVMHSVTYRRSYKVGENWRETQKLFDVDLLSVARLLERAWEWIASQQAKRGDSSED